MALLKLERVRKKFGGLLALGGLELDVNQGEILGLIGPNGSGKTTTFNLITGFFRPDSGKITFEGKDITDLNPYMIAQRGIIRTFQLTNLFSDFTVLENVLIGFHCLSKTSFLEGLLNTHSYRNEEEKLVHKAREILEFTELGSQEEKFAKNLSAGWRKTLAIAIALAANPNLLLLDEPVCTLSPARVTSIMNLIKKLRESGVTIMVIEHNMKAIMDYCDRIVVLNFGKKIAEGSPEEIKKSRDVIQAYLGV
jgi:branched-chain amino acid transport system ATP-binding protein